MTPQKDVNRLTDILLAIDAIQTYTDSDSREEIIRDAIKYQLIVVGEASHGLGSDVRALVPEIPWQRIRAFRNLVIQEYASVDPDTVTTIIQEHLPELRAAIIRLFVALEIDPPSDVGPPT